ncbi:mitochondrial ribosomal subunit protein-domain-containing protein [Amylocystis lapponica]|nr:mitochondrial ribosomal subunit protein-domain-containing protein [Amylocystis lapponica]
MSVTRASRAALPSFHHAHHFHSSAASMARRNTASTKEKRVGGLLISEDIISEEPAGTDTSSAGHLRLQQQRQRLYYLRLIEHEMPKLVAVRPAKRVQPLVVRTISYGGETHPAETKRTIVVPVARLPLKGAAAVHKFKLLAGPRWTIEPPRDAGVGADENAGEHGYFKITCEDFPKPAMNLKWASDTLDRLLAEANDPQDKFEDLPLDTRHMEARTRKAKKGDHVYGRGGVRPSIRDFPKEWLPAAAAPASTDVSTTQ